MSTFAEKLDMVSDIFREQEQETVESGDKTPLQDGTYYGGIYNGRKYMYSRLMIETLSIEKLEFIIRKQINNPKP